MHNRGSVLVCYDIADNKRRRKVDKALSKIGERVQESVFLTRKPRGEVLATLSKLIDEGVDDVRIQPLCATCQAGTVHLGGVPVGVERAFRVV